MGKLVVGLARFLILCAFVLLLPALATSQTPQPTPGWYKNSGPSIMYEAPSQNSILRVVWENSYIYQHPGTDNLYWYAQVAYQNIGSQPLPVICPGATDPSIAKEHILGGIQELAISPVREPILQRMCRYCAGKIRQRVSSVSMLMPMWCEGSMRDFWLRDPYQTNHVMTSVTLARS